MRRLATELAPAGLAVLLGVFFTADGDSDGAPIAVEATAGLVAVALLLAFRRSRPVLLTLILIPSGILLGMPMGVTPIALFSVGLHRPPRVTVALLVLHAVLTTVTYALAMGLTAAFREAVVFLVLLHVCVVTVALLVRADRQLIASWADRARQAEEGQRLRVDQARMAERERIAREMHDVLAHRISLLAVHAGALEVRREAPAAEREAAGVVRRCAYEALEDLREVIGMLRAPDAVEDDDRPQPTLGDLPALVAQSHEAGAEVDLAVEVGGGPVGSVGRHAYRIVQEGLTNARKHAPGAPVRVTVSGGAETGLTIRVANPLAVRRITTGVAAAIPGAGAGLAGLTERVQLAGGRVEHGPTAGGDFQLRAWLPWQP